MNPKSFAANEMALMRQLGLEPRDGMTSKVISSDQHHRLLFLSLCQQQMRLPEILHPNEGDYLATRQTLLK
jgi:hypothetical protein